MNRRFFNSRNVALSISMLSCSWMNFAAEHTPPLMINIPAGDFFMGSETGDSNVKPMKKVSLPAFQLSQYPITVAEFRQFTKATGYAASLTCLDHIDESWLGGPNSVGTASWEKHRYLKSDYQPVTCINYSDAMAYAHWITQETGTSYRLPTEQEWEYAAKANTTSRYFWGDDPLMTQACHYGNFADHSSEYFASEQYGASYKGFLEHANCDDGEPYISIVGLYRANPFGLYDMVGNISQLLATCYYDGYGALTPAQTDLNNCEKISHRGGTWHFPPQPHASRARADRVDPSPGALMGFRLASDGHHKSINSTRTSFERGLKIAQEERLTTRVKIPKAPSNLYLVKQTINTGELHWQPVHDERIVSYDIYRSTIARANFIGRHYKRIFSKLTSVNAKQHKLSVELPISGASYLVVARTATVSSLASDAITTERPVTVSLPGRINIKAISSIENASLVYRKATKEKPELYYVSKVNKSLEQPLVTMTFKVNIKESGWHQLNYRGKSRQEGEFFKLWQNERLLGSIEYNREIDDKVSNRHRVYLHAGTHNLQLTVKQQGFDYWSFDWLDFEFIES